MTVEQFQLLKASALTPITADLTAAAQAAGAAGAAPFQTGAETARDAAVVARTGAETAQTGAQTARTGAETAQTGAQTARTGAETARDVALGARDAAQLAAAAITPMDVLHLISQGSYTFPVPAGWWDTGLRQTATDSLRGTTSTMAIISNWNAETLRGAGPNVLVLAHDAARIFGADGVTAVSAPGTSVSLAADDWQGITTGAQLVTGSPTLPTGWSGTGPWTKVAGTANSATWSIGTLVSGRTYAVEITYDAITASTLTPRFTGGATVTGLSRSAAGSYRQIIIATAAHTTLDLQATATTAAVVSSVSVRELTNWPAYQNTSAARPTWGRAPAQVRNLLLGTATMATQSRVVTAAQHTLSFKGTGTVTLSGVSTSGPLVGTGAGDRVSLTFTPTAGTLTMTVSGSVTEAQLELGAAASAYQEVGASTNDITETGVTSFGLISMDGSDDALLHQLAAGGTVSVALFGRGGSYLIPSITLAAPSVLQLGPLSVLDDGVLVSGCPTGILRAVGTVPWSSRFELVGYAIMKANPSAEDQARAMRYFAAHGARGWLVEGPELVPNPGNPFISTTGYSAGGAATISVDTGRLKVDQTVGFTDGVLCALPNDSFSDTKLISFDVDLGTSTLVQVQAGNGNFGNGEVITVNITASGSYNIITTTRNPGAASLTFKSSTASNFFLSRVSLRALAPEF